MIKGNLDNRFKGQARLVRLLLWKIGESTDVSVGLESALAHGMIGDDDARFLLQCIEAEERDRDSDAMSFDVTPEAVDRLQRCADKLNRADSA